MADRRAVLISATKFADSTLRALDAPDGDAADLAQVLRSPSIGGFSVETLINASSNTVLESIERLFESERHRDDQLLLYLSTHGVKTCTAGCTSRVPTVGRIV